LEALAPPDESALAPAVTEDTPEAGASTGNGRMADEEARGFGLLSSDVHHESASPAPSTVTSADQHPPGGLELEVGASALDEWATPAPETSSAVPTVVDEPDTDADIGDDHGEPIPTRTLAELYAQQGAVTEAIAVLRHLLAGRPNDLKLAARIEELEGGWTPPRPPRADEPAEVREGEGEDEVDALARELAESGGSPHAHTEGDSPFSWGDATPGGTPTTEGQTIRDYFDGLLRWEPPEP
jgi:hypothetical protein